MFFGLSVALVMLCVVSALTVPKLSAIQVSQFHSNPIIIPSNQSNAPRYYESTSILSAGNGLEGNITILVPSGQSSSRAGYALYILDEAQFSHWNNYLYAPTLFSYYSGSNVNTYGQSKVVFPVNVPINSDGPDYFAFFFPTPTAEYPTFFLNQTYTSVDNITTASSIVQLPFSTRYLSVSEAFLGVFIAYVARAEQKSKEGETRLKLNKLKESA